MKVDLRRLIEGFGDDGFNPWRLVVGYLSSVCREIPCFVYAPASVDSLAHRMQGFEIFVSLEDRVRRIR